MSAALAFEIHAAAGEMQPQLQKWYRHLHRHPEMAHKEFQTNAYIRAELDKMGISYLAPKDNITIAVVSANKPGETIGYRFDTDALMVEEQSGLPYASENPGMMHACGHDGHIAVGLCTAYLLKTHPDDWSGTAKLIFQPAEEGEDGADRVIATHLVDDVDRFFCLHFWSAYPTGHLCVSEVTTSAAVNMMEIRIHGKGGHGGMPQVCHDALVAGAELVGALQTVVSRVLPPTTPSLLTIGSFHAGTQGNIIAGEAVLRGTLRTVNEDDRRKAEDAIAAMVHHIAAMHGCTAEIENRRMSDAVTNAPIPTGIARRAAELLAEQDPALCPDEQRTMMTGDDFANYGRIAPYVYAQLGTADPEKGTDAPLHNAKFRLDEDMLPVGAAWMTLCAMV
ncbi:MAG: amidohydrolase [Ruminococcaceae bacterium]|nr:amidohydrolase [Oscillospiraceae bacterium]